MWFPIPGVNFTSLGFLNYTSVVPKLNSWHDGEGGHSLGGARGHIKAHGLSLFPHQRKLCTEGLLGLGYARKNTIYIERIWWFPPLLKNRQLIILVLISDMNCFLCACVSMCRLLFLVSTIALWLYIHVHCTYMCVFISRQARSMPGGRVSGLPAYPVPVPADPDEMVNIVGCLHVSTCI